MTFAQSALARAKPLWARFAARAPDRAERLRELAAVRAVTSLRGDHAEVSAGTIGTIVHVHREGQTFEVEFHTPTPAVLLAQRDQIEAA